MKKRMNTKKLVYIGLLAAVATALMYLEPVSYTHLEHQKTVKRNRKSVWQQKNK